MNNQPVIMTSHINDPALHRLAATIVAAYVATHPIPTGELAGLIRAVHAALAGLGREPAVASPHGSRTPAVPIRKSVTLDWITCLEDGCRVKMLRRHLRTAHGLTPDDYRARWGLPPEYPMVAPNYAKRRADLAVASGLGRNRRRKP